MAEKLKNKVTDEELKIRATSDEKITVKLTNNYAFQKIFKKAKIVKGFLMALLNLKEYEIKKIEITDPFTLGENNEEKEGILDIKLVLNQNRKINIEMQNTYQDDWTNEPFLQLPNVYRWFSKRSSLQRTPTLYPCRYLKFQPDDKPKLLP